MDTLIRFGFSIEDIKSMMDTNHSIDSVNDKDIKDLIELLQEINCEEEQIKNILLCNPFYLTNSIYIVKDLINKLKNIGCANLNILFENNPYLLNLEKESLERIYNEKIHEGFTKEEIIDYIYYEEVI